MHTTIYCCIDSTVADIMKSIVSYLSIDLSGSQAIKMTSADSGTKISALIARAGLPATRDRYALRDLCDINLEGKTTAYEFKLTGFEYFQARNHDIKLTGDFVGSILPATAIKQDPMLQKLVPAKAPSIYVLSMPAETIELDHLLAVDTPDYLFEHQEKLGHTYRLLAWLTDEAGYYDAIFNSSNMGRLTDDVRMTSNLNGSKIVRVADESRLASIVVWQLVDTGIDD